MYRCMAVLCLQCVEAAYKQGQLTADVATDCADASDAAAIAAAKECATSIGVDGVSVCCVIIYVNIYLIYIYVCVCVSAIVCYMLFISCEDNCLSCASYDCRAPCYVACARPDITNN
jgi:hypothetical protein